MKSLKENLNVALNEASMPEPTSAEYKEAINIVKKWKFIPREVMYSLCSYANDVARYNKSREDLEGLYNEGSRLFGDADSFWKACDVIGRANILLTYHDESDIFADFNDMWMDKFHLLDDEDTIDELGLDVDVINSSKEIYFMCSDELSAYLAIPARAKKEYVDLCHAITDKID